MDKTFLLIVLVIAVASLSPVAESFTSGIGNVGKRGSLERKEVYQKRAVRRMCSYAQQRRGDLAARVPEELKRLVRELCF